MRLLAHCEVGGFGCGEGMGLHESGGARTLILAHVGPPRNLSCVDVTDPRRPRVLAHLDLPHDRVRSNSLALSGDLLAVAYEVEEPGLGPAGVELFDVGRPAQPRRLGFFDASGPGSRGTHHVSVVGDSAYLSTGMPGFEATHPLDDQFVVILDVGDPERPREEGRWWLPGTRLGDPEPPPERHPVQHGDGGFRAHTVIVDPAMTDRAFVGYLDGGLVILDIADPARPRQVSRLDYHPPLPGFTHTVLPLPGRGLAVVTDEAILDGCEDHPKNLWVMDVSHEANPVPLSTAPMPPAEEACGRGGRFGAHNVHENDPVPTSWRSEEVIVGTFFNAGVRAFDIRDPFRPRELGYLVPPAPLGSPAGAIQINDVYVDERGVIYAVDRFTGGLYIIEAGW